MRCALTSFAASIIFVSGTQQSWSQSTGGADVMRELSTPAQSSHPLPPGTAVPQLERFLI